MDIASRTNMVATSLAGRRYGTSSPPAGKFSRAPGHAFHRPRSRRLVSRSGVNVDEVPGPGGVGQRRRARTRRPAAPRTARRRPAARASRRRRPGTGCRPARYRGPAARRERLDDHGRQDVVPGGRRRSPRRRRAWPPVPPNGPGVRGRPRRSGTAAAASATGRSGPSPAMRSVPSAALRPPRPGVQHQLEALLGGQPAGEQEAGADRGGRTGIVDRRWA